MNAIKKILFICSILFLLLAGITYSEFMGLEEIQNSYLINDTTIYDDSSRGMALNALLDSEDLLSEMSESNFSNLFMQDTLVAAKKYYIGKNVTAIKEEYFQENDSFKEAYLLSLIDFYNSTKEYDSFSQNYSMVLKLATVMRLRRNHAYSVYDTIELLTQKEQNYSSMKINTSLAKNLLDQAQISFREERYSESEDFLAKAEIELEYSVSEVSRIKNLYYLNKTYLEKYYMYIIPGFIIFLIIIYYSARKIRLVLIKKKIERLEMELMSTKNLIKKAQEACFVNKTITESTYYIMESRYKDRIIKIKRMLPVLRHIVSKKR